MCVPHDQVENAADLFHQSPDVFESFGPSALKRVAGLEDYYPRFKFVGLRLFFILMSDHACHLDCRSANIEHSTSRGIPFPTLPVYAQSLLDSLNIVDLEDLIDGMNLTPEWGEEHLDLEGTPDTQWGRWKADLVSGGKATEDNVPRWCFKPPLRRELWMKKTSSEAKRQRQGLKHNPNYETRFWRKGRKDPRSRW